MKKILFLFCTIFALVLFVIPEKAKATHASAGYITYKYIGPNTFLVSLHFYRDCAGIAAPTSAIVSYNSSCIGGGTVTLFPVAGTGEPVERSPCVPYENTICSGGTAYGIQEWVYADTVILPVNCSDWKFSYSLCCRNDQIGTLMYPGAQNIYIESSLNTIAAPTNSAPEFLSIPVTEFCVNSPVIWDQFAVDPDNDSLVYSIVCPLQNTNQIVSFASGYTCANPIQALPAVSINPLNGQITFTPTLAQVAIITVKVDEYRGGLWIGSINKDMQINIVANCDTATMENTWLGYNSNWNDLINWCQGVPTLLTDVVVRSLRSLNYFSPIISNGIYAQAKSLTIIQNDSVIVNSPSSGSLTIADSLIINNGSLTVQGSFYGDETFGNGTFIVPPITPFAANRSDARMELLYRESELLAAGLLPGDSIYELVFHIFRRRSLDPYLNFTIKYYTTTQSSYVINQDATTTSGPFVIYSNAAGESLAAIPYFAGGLHTVTLDAPFIWNGGNFLIEICFDEFVINPSNNTDIMTQTRTTGANTVLLHELIGLNLGIEGCVKTGPAALTNGPSVVSSISEYRPNITFKYYRSYDVFPIYIQGAWQAKPELNKN